MTGSFHGPMLHREWKGISKYKDLCEMSINYNICSGGAKVQVTGHRTGHRSQVQVTGHRSQVTMKNTCKFAGSSYLVGICLFRPFLT